MDGEWGSSTHYDYGFRIYNPSIGKFLSVDPLMKGYPMLTPYQFASNTPIAAIDLDGLEMLIVGSRQFEAQTVALIKGLAMTKTGRKLLTQIANSGRTLVIKDSDDIENYNWQGNKQAGVAKEGTYGSDKINNDILFLSGDIGVNMQDEPARSEHKIDDSPIAAFGHELQHFLDAISTVIIPD